MNAMVSEDQISRLGDGWMHLAMRQCKDWEAMEPQADQAQADEAAAKARIEKHLAGPGEA